MPAEMRDEINGAMSRLGPSKSSRWSVRTSAIYDDLDEKYEPVINQTFLGLHDYQVVSHVLKCWAHIFSQNSVEYRIKFGLPLDDPVGVCVQLMIEPDASGCLYSRHPITGDPRKIYIRSVYGIAESINSDEVDPDQMVVRRRGDLQKAELLFDRAKIGAKSQRLTADRTTYDVSAEQACQLSLSEEVILRIAEIGQELDQLYDSVRDINWALIDDKIYLLQCRTVQGIDDWTDFELTHELGSGVPADKDLLTFAQAGEIFSSCLTPLTCTTICEALASTTFSSAIRTFDDTDYDKSPLFIVNMRVAFNYFNVSPFPRSRATRLRVFFFFLFLFLFLQLMMRNCEETISKNMIARDYALCGRRIITPEVHDAAKRRNCIACPIDRIKLFGGKVQDYLWGSQVMVDGFEKTIENIYLRESLSAKKLFRALDHDLGVLNKVSKCYGHVLRSSTWYQVQLLTLLAGDNEEITAQNFADFARLMRYCRNVVTAQLPKLITKVADCRGQYVPPNPDPNELVQWDNKWGPKGVSPISAFIWAFGHLGPNELELSSMPYHTMREDIYDVLEFVKPRLDHNMLRRRERSPTPEEEIIKKTKDGKDIPWRPNEPPGQPIDELVREIKSPITPQTRHSIWKILQMTHSTVARREQCKALVSKAVQNVRTLMGHEACYLMNVGKLPDMGIIFYFTRWELEEFLQDDRPYQTELIRKAHRRRKLWAELNKKRYPEFFYGMPQPIEKDEFGPEVRNADFKIYGTPVCPGSACRRVVVVRSLGDATLLRQWDILVAPMIDVGWSHYFPLLAGIITEQGGILSQGAVIARENSMPCIMGVPNATRIFRTVHFEGERPALYRLHDQKGRTSSIVRPPRPESAKSAFLSIGPNDSERLSEAEIDSVGDANSKQSSPGPDSDDVFLSRPSSSAPDSSGESQNSSRPNSTVPAVDVEFQLTSHVLMKKPTCTIRYYGYGAHEYEPHVAEFALNSDNTLAILLGFVSFEPPPCPPNQLCRLEQKLRVHHGHGRQGLEVAYLDMYRETLDALCATQQKTSQLYFDQPHGCLLFQNLDVQAWIKRDVCDGEPRLFIESIDPRIDLRTRIAMTRDDYAQLCRLYPTLIQEYQKLTKQRRGRAKRPLELTSESPYTDIVPAQVVQIKIRLVGDLPIGDYHYLQFFNIVVRRCLEHLKLQLVGRDYYDPSCAIDVKEYKLQLWPGYITSIRQHERDVMMCVETSFKVMRQQTLYDLLTECREKNPRDFKNMYADQVLGSVVLTDYNNKTYKIDDIDWENNPKHTFTSKDDEKIIYADYYRNKYSIKLRDMGQPLLVSRSTARDRRAGQSELIYLIPELCRSTGLTDTMRKDFKTMRALAEHTRLVPQTRIERLLQFNRRLSTNKDISNEFDEWNFKFEDHLTDVPARIIETEKIHFHGKAVTPKTSGDWNFDAQENKMFAVSKLNSWHVIVPSKHVDDAKKELCITAACPSQVLQAKTLRQKSPGMMKSVSSKVAVQLNCKIGGHPWTVELSHKVPNMMVIGFDVCHDKASTDYATLCASTGAKTTACPSASSSIATAWARASCATSRTTRSATSTSASGLYGGEEKVKLTFIIVTKRINTRIFHNGRNPQPGTIVDDVITSPLKFDFFLVSQNVRQGTVSPTAYNIIHNSGNLSANALQKITYKFCHMYFNFSGTVRVPAPCQYAHKLAFFTSQALRTPAHQALRNTLYFL
ncbi:unnamed protein product [Trichogramma brassicae]|uniref:Uncharacterized protein n=1 Tax=Trichogramma brassicae TaxID=86971 RepID=A0A6H5J9I0_9HYME|nr:unnamed protein product [Trichogramma brassicae]